MTKPDRAVLALIYEAENDLSEIVALVLRTVRDDLAEQGLIPNQPRQAGDILGDTPSANPVVEYLNARITNLSGEPTTLGDTTE